jgi:hypothetical protein
MPPSVLPAPPGPPGRRRPAVASKSDTRSGAQSQRCAHSVRRTIMMYLLEVSTRSARTALMATAARARPKKVGVRTAPRWRDRAAPRQSRPALLLLVALPLLLLLLLLPVLVTVTVHA